MSNIIYKWSFTDTKTRWSMWYIITASIVLWLAIWWIFTGQYWLSLIIILLTWITLFVENNSADNVEINILELWIKIWDFFYDYSVIESYSFIYNWENPIYIRIILKKSWIKNIDLKIDNKICYELKDILKNYLQETKSTELTVIEKTIKLLKL